MIVNDVTDAFVGWLEPLTGSRCQGSYVSGRWVTGETEALSFDGIVQDATAKDLLVLEEGDRAKEAIKVHTTYKLMLKDIISYDGYNWVVYNVANKKIGNYYKSIAIKQ